MCSPGALERSAATAPPTEEVLSTPAGMERPVSCCSGIPQKTKTPAVLPHAAAGCPVSLAPAPQDGAPHPPAMKSQAPLGATAHGLACCVPCPSPFPVNPYLREPAEGVQCCSFPKLEVGLTKKIIIGYQREESG